MASRLREGDRGGVERMADSLGYEYGVPHGRADKVEKQLNELAAQGWEFVAVASGTLFMTSIGIAGAYHAAFAQTNTCGSQLAAAASCTITVTFKPTAKGTTAATVMIVDSASTSPQKVNVAGVGN